MKIRTPYRKFPCCKTEFPPTIIQININRSNLLSYKDLPICRKTSSRPGTPGESIHAMSMVICMPKNQLKIPGDIHGSWMSLHGLMDICIFSVNGLLGMDIAWALQPGKIIYFGGFSG